MFKGHNNWAAMGSENCFIHVQKGEQPWPFFFSLHDILKECTGEINHSISFIVLSYHT